MALIVLGLLVVTVGVAVVQLARQSKVWRLVIVLIVALVAIMVILTNTLTPAS